MSLLGIALKSSVRQTTLESILDGTFPEGSGSAWGISSTSRQQFVDGEATLGIATLLGVQTETAQELRDRLGREGAIGLLVGIAIGVNKDK